MKKIFKLSNLDCANCAAKMERNVQKISGVINANVNFMTQKLALEAIDDQFEEIVLEVIRVCKRIEPDIIFIGK